MTNKKELNNEELNKVSGGTIDTHGKYVLGKKLGQYETADYIGHEVVHYSEQGGHHTVSAYGTLMKSYEKTFGCGTRRTCEIKKHPDCDGNATTTSEGYALVYADVGEMYLIERYL